MGQGLGGGKQEGDGDICTIVDNKKYILKNPCKTKIHIFKNIYKQKDICQIELSCLCEEGKGNKRGKSNKNILK